MVDRNRSGWRIVPAAGILLLLAAGPAAAQTLDQDLHIHGFGDWIYGHTDGNQYESGDRNGNYDDAAFGLNIHYDATDRVALVGQIAFDHGEADEKGGQTILDYAFGQYKINDKIHLRFGRTYHPFGIYSEIRDIGTARLFVERPPEIYGDVGIISTSLNGLDLYGDLFQTSRWRLHYDVYGGATDLTEAQPEQQPATTETIQDIIGTKLTFDTPLNGLHVTLSGFQGRQKATHEDHRSDAVSLDYTSERWMVRAEAAEHVESSEHLTGAYIEGGFRPAGPWQFVARYGIARERGDASPVDPAFLRHRDASVGIDYWFDPRLILKAEYHAVSGNRLALPETDHAGPPDPDTRALEVGVQFSF